MIFDSQKKSYKTHKFKLTTIDNLEHIQALESQIGSLKKENEHYKTLDLNMSKKNEEISSLKSQLMSLNLIRSELASLQVEHSSLLQDKAKWTSFCQINEFSDPTEMARALASERLQVADLKDRLGQEQAEKAGREAYIQSLETQVQEAQGDSNAQGQIQKLEKQIRVLERTKQLARRESDFFREQLVKIEFNPSIRGVS